MHSTEYLDLALEPHNLQKIANNSKFKYAVRPEKLVDIIGSKGIKAIEAKRFEPTTLEGKEWNLKSLSKLMKKSPKNVEMYDYEDGRISFRFNNYKPSSSQNNFEEEDSD